MKQAKTRAQIAAEYGISRKTFYNWLKKEGLTFQKRRLINPKEIEIIYNIFGNPNEMNRNPSKFFE